MQRSCLTRTRTRRESQVGLPVSPWVPWPEEDQNSGSVALNCEGGGGAGGSEMDALAWEVPRAKKQ